MKSLVRCLRAMADEPRMTMLTVLSLRGAVCVSHLQEAMRTPQPTVSRYLSILRNAGLLDSERRGQWVYYSLSDGEGSLVTELILKSAEQLKEAAKIKKIMERLDKLEQQPTLPGEGSEVKTEKKVKKAGKVKARPERSAAAKGKVARTEQIALTEPEIEQETAHERPAVERMAEAGSKQYADTSGIGPDVMEKQIPDSGPSKEEPGPGAGQQKKNKRKKPQPPSLFDL